LLYYIDISDTDIWEDTVDPFAAVVAFRQYIETACYRFAGMTLVHLGRNNG